MSLIIRSRIEGFEGADVYRMMATAASTDPKTVNKIAGEASKIYDVAASSLSAAPTKGQSQANEKDQILKRLELVKTNSSFTRVSIASGSTIVVYLVSSKHPATMRWEYGTRRTPGSNFMHRGWAAGQK